MNRKILFSDPGQYIIQVDGILDESLMDIIENFLNKPGLTIHSEVTTIRGQVKDQAALSGLLNAFYDHRHIILSVQQMEDNLVEDNS